MLPIEQRKKILELRSQWLSLTQIRDMVKELYWRRTLSVATCWNVIREWQEAPTEEDEDAVVDRLLDANYWSLLERKYYQQKERMVKRALLYQQSADLIIDKFKEELWSWLSPIVLPPIPSKKDTNKSVHILVLSDLHYWRQTAELITNFKNVLIEVAEIWTNEIDIMCLWDLFETPILTWMHADQLLDLDVIGVKQVIECVDMILNWIEWLYSNWIKVNNFTIVSGNHDRITKNWNEDPEKIIMILAMEYLKAKIWDKINVNFWAQAILITQMYGCNFILHHWDNWFIQKPDTQILQTYGRMDMFNIIISWHTHTAALAQGTNYIRMRCPALCQPWRYEKDQYIWASNPGFAIINIDNWVPSIDLRLLPFITFTK